MSKEVELTFEQQGSTLVEHYEEHFYPRDDGVFPYVSPDKIISDFKQRVQDATR